MYTLNMLIKIKKFRTVNLTEDESWFIVYTLGKTFFVVLQATLNNLWKSCGKQYPWEASQRVNAVSWVMMD